MELPQTDPNANSEISIWIDKYDDVFSDFDSRPYNERVLSDDFLSEIRKMMMNQPKSDVKLTFRLMDDRRDYDTEKIIMDNIRIYFQRAADGIRSEMMSIRNKGYWMTGGGFALSIFLIFLSDSLEGFRYINQFPLVLEPIAWFSTWTGLDHIFQMSRKGNESYAFNKKMVDADINFLSLEIPELSATGTTGTAGPVKKKVIPFGNNLRIAQ